MTTLNLRINLLPPEIFGRKKGERLVAVLSLSLLALCSLLVFIFLFNAFRITLAQGELNQVAAKNRKVTKEISKLKPFADKKQLLERREKTRELATAGEVAWTKIFNEVSMVIPGDISLTKFEATEEGKLTVEGYTPDYPVDSPDLGHKPVAKWIGRFVEVQKLEHIWLNYSEKESDDSRIKFELGAQIEGVANGETDGTTSGEATEAKTSASNGNVGK